MNIETLATLKHINVRKEGSDEKILAIDVRFNCQIPSDVLIEFHPTLRTMLWTQDGEPRFNRLIESIAQVTGAVRRPVDLAVMGPVPKREDR